MTMNSNRRLLMSLAAGVLIPLLALAGSFLGAVLAYRWHVEWFGKAFLWLIAWPLALLKPITPNSEEASRQASNVRLAILIAVPVLDVVAYSLLAYLILWWRDIRNQRG